MGTQLLLEYTLNSCYYYWHRSAELAVNKVQRGANKEVRQQVSE